MNYRDAIAAALAGQRVARPNWPGWIEAGEFHGKPTPFMVMPQNQVYCTYEPASHDEDRRARDFFCISENTV